MSVAAPALRKSSPSRLEWEAIALALVIAHAFYARSLVYPSSYDALKYREIADHLASVGLFAKFHFSHLRTYAYPLLLAELKPVAQWLHVPWSLVIFELQLATYLAAAWFIRSRIVRISPAVARTVFVALVVNPFALLYCTDSLTEALSVTLVMIAAACAIHLFCFNTRILASLAAGSFALGLALMVRPANLYALPAWVVVVFAAAWLRRWNVGRQALAIVLLVVFVALPTLPQLANNVRHYDRWTPFVVFDLGNFQLYWGVRSLKYATAMLPITYPSVYYENPLTENRPVDPDRPIDWYARYPLQALATMGLHVFGMLDQDLLFTYARDLDPWYRRPLGVLTHGFIALALGGLAMLGVRARADRTARAIVLTLATLIAAHVALHATTAVEMRFALPLLVLAGPLGTWFVLAFWPRASTTRQVAMAAFVTTWVASSLVLSDWIREQAPQIRAWNAGVPFVPPPP